MARNKKVEILSHDGQVLHPITDGDCVIFPDGETLTHKLSEDEAVMYTPEVTNSSPMFKVGEGDSSDYSANVLDGAYQEAVLKGQTYVNTIQEPSADVITLPTPFTEYERTQSKTFTEMQDGTFGLNLVGQSYVNCIQEPSEPSYVALGENLEFQNKKVEYTSDGQIKSAMLKGQTLVNLANNTAGIVTVTPGGGWKWLGTRLEKLEANKTYMSIFYVDSNTLDGVIKDVFQTVDSNGNLSTVWGVTVINASTTGIFKRKFKLKSDIKHYYAYSDTSTTGSATLKCMILEYQEGMENWDIHYFQGMQSVTMSTELENVCSRYNSSVAKNGKTFTIGSADSRTLKLSPVANISNYNFKQNTKYLLQFKITNLNLDGLNSITLYFSEGDISGGNALFGNLVNASASITRNGIYRVVLTTSTIIDTSGFVIKGLGSQWENSSSTSRKLTISNIMCIEYQNGMENWDLPYFETTQLMKPVKVQSVSKNLFSTANMSTSYKTTVSEVTTNSFRLTGTDSSVTYKNTPFIFNVKPNTNYKITFKSEVSDGDSLCDVYDMNNKYLGNTSFNSGNSTWVSVRFYVNMNNTKNGTVKYYDVQMEESSTETPYTPHQSKTTSALEPITLRAIGDVKDTLDLSTGEYVQRIGELVLDGSNDEGWYTDGNVTDDTSILFRIIISNAQEEDSINLLCDKFKSKFCYQKNTGEATYISFLKELTIRINKDKLSENSVNGFIAYLQQNPIKVQYILAKPITRKISLEYPNLQTYQDITHVQSIAMNGTLIPNIYLPSDISYKAMLKPNTSYNVIVDREVIDSTNQLTVNLGGTTTNITANRTVVRTPSTLSNETLTFSGKGNRIGKVMLIENSTLLNGDIPYFEGIGDVHLGRVVENLCLGNENLAGSFGGNATVTQYQDKLTCKLGKEGSLVACFSLTKQLLNGKKYFAYCPWDCSSSSHTFGAGFRMRYNGNDLFGQQIKGVDNKKYIIFTIDEKEQLNPYIQFTIGHHGNMPVNTTLTFYRPILCEYIEGMENWDWESIGYFTGTKNVGNEFMRIGNKNLFDGTFYNHYWSAPFTNGGSAISKQNSSSCASTCRIPVKKGLTYTLSGTNLNRDIITFFKTDDMNEKPFDGLKQTTFTSPYDGYIEWYISNTHDTAPVTNVQIEEASSATSYVAHKHNALYLPKDEPIALSWEQGSISYSTGGSWTDATNNTNTTRIRTQLLDLEPNETYRVSYGGNGYKYAIGFYNNSNIGSSVLTTTTMNEYYFTTTKDVHKIGIVVTTSNDGNITPSALHQIRLEKVTDIHLRSVGSVKDELDLTRGVYIQRIGEIIVDGSENWATEAKNSNVTSRFGLKVNNMLNENINIVHENNLNANGVFPVLFDGSGDQEQIFSHYGAINIRINDSKLNAANDKDSFKAYLQSNPITVQYKLETPIEHKINIPMKNESNQTIAKPNGIFTLPLMHSGNNHVDINSQIYPKVQSRDYISYPVIASPSNKYTVFHNKVGSTDLTVNLCGASTTVNAHKNTITTPSSISQYELRLSGANNKVSNVCVFNGDYMNVNVPYVQGMMNAVNPTVKNIGRNLFDGELELGGYDEKGRPMTTADTLYRNKNKYIPIIGGINIACNYDVFIHQYDYNKNFIKYSQINKKTLTMKLDINTRFINFRTSNKSHENIQIEYGTIVTQYEPYKENNCKPDYGQVYLTQDMLEQGAMYYSHGNSYSSMINNTETSRIRLKKLLCLKENTTYVIKIDSDYMFALGLFNENEISVSSSSVSTWRNEYVFTTTSDACKLGFCIRKSSNRAIGVSEFNDCNITLYELDKEITLRSLPNGVRDELNLETGEYIQRIGEIIVDGSDNNYTISSAFDGGDTTSTTCRFEIKNTMIKNVDERDGNMNCDKLVWRMVWQVSDGREGCYVASSSNRIIVRMKKDRFESLDSNNIKKYLSQNPMTIQFELATPIIKHIDIHNYPHSYKDGHVIIENNDPTTSVPAQLTYKCVTNRSGQIQEHTEQVEKQERQINELETLILENIRQNQNRSQNFLTSLISTLEIEEE